ncbi:MAG: glycoside hydrolase family 3 N-terminal domain-containing protein, partial [Verrucomicrobiota bacterium]
MALVFAGASGNAWAIGNFTNSGRVVDKDGKPVDMAMVTYQNPDRSLDYTYTDANGSFSASAAQEGAKPAAALQGATAIGGVVDTLRIGKTGYQPVLVPIKTYSEHIKTVTLVPIDIEAKVNAVMVKHQGDVTWMAGQITGALQDIPDADLTTSKPGALFAPMELTQPTAAAWADQVDAKQKASLQAGTPLLLVGGLVVHGWAYRILPDSFDRTPKPYTQDETRKMGQNGVVFPHNSALGCMNDPELVEQAYRVMALEARGAGLNWTLAPFVEPIRNIKSGRSFESFSADPAVAAQLSRAAILGLQGTDLSSPYTIAATAKYFLGSGGTVDGKTWGDAAIAPEPVMKSLFLPSYQSAIDVGVAGILVDRHSWLGKPVCESPYLLTSLLKEQMKFDGIVVADWNDGSNPAPNPSPDPKAPPFPNPWTPDTMSAAASFVGNGIDLNSAGGNYKEFAAALQNAVATGKVSKERLTDAVRRVLRLKAKMGLLDSRNAVVDRELTRQIDSPAHKEIARRCVRESLVLLKSDSVLPLKRNQRILVVGKAAGIE